MTAPSYPSRPPQLTEWHLGGQVAVYIRQSNLDQVRHHLGSGMAQRAQVEFLKRCGFQDSQIVVIDEDMGRSGTSTKRRSGWQTLLAGIVAGTIRVVAMTEVSRLGRDNAELAQFLTLCEYKNVLLIDNGVPRNPREIGDWTTMAIEGVLADQENRRKTERIRNSSNAKVQAGLWPRQLPPGFDRGPGGEAIKTADPAVREILERIWREALLGKSVRAIARTLRAEGLNLPVRGPQRTHRWVQPTGYGVRGILRNSFYAGQFTVWKHRTERTPDGPAYRSTTPDERLTLAGKIEIYVTLEEFQRVQALLNARGLRTDATAGLGLALCDHLVWCQSCQRRLYVDYLTQGHVPQHHYRCRGAQAMDDLALKCVWVSGQQLDRAVEEIVLAALQKPSPVVLRRAIQEDNARRQSASRLLAEQVRRADAEAAKARARLEESRQRDRNPRVIELYEDALNAALERQQTAKARVAAAPPVALIETSAAFVGTVASVFAQLPRLWRSGRLDIEDRKRIVRLVVRRIEILDRTDPMPMKIILHSAKVLDWHLYRMHARRQLIEALAAEGRNPEEIAAELNRRHILNKAGRPITAAKLKRMPAYRQFTPARRWTSTRQATIELLRALWYEGLPKTAIAERLNTQSLRWNGETWTTGAVCFWVRRLKLPMRWRIVQEILRAHVTELVQAGCDDAAIAETLNARGVMSFAGKSWTTSRIQWLRRQLRISGTNHNAPGQDGDESPHAPRDGRLPRHATDDGGDHTTSRTLHDTTYQEPYQYA